MGSIASEINRIKYNISDSLDAVTEKGVTVPSGSNSNNLAELIRQITFGLVETFGSDDNGNLLYKSIAAEFTVDENGYLKYSAAFNIDDSGYFSMVED